MPQHYRAILVAAFTFMSLSAVHAEEMGDPVAGEKVFAKCKACHVVEEATNRVGPTLNGVIGRVPGTVEGFKYSKAMTEYGTDRVWDEETLAAYLHAPRDVVKGTRMAFAGLKDDADIANVIAYMKQFSQ